MTIGDNTRLSRSYSGAPIAESLPPAAGRPSRDITRGNRALPRAPALRSKITALPQPSQTRDKSDFPISFYPASFTFPRGSFPPEEPSRCLLPTLHPDCSLLIYCIASLFPTTTLFLGGSSLLSPFAPPTQRYHPVFGEVQDDFSPRYRRSAPGQISTGYKRSHPVLAPTPPLQREKEIK